MTEPEKPHKKSGITPGLAIIGCQATGVVGLLGGFIQLIYQNPVGGGVCLIAAAIAFGIVVFVSFSE